MKPKTLIILILIIITCFLLQGAHLIDQIHCINHQIQSHEGFTKENINLLCVEMQNLEYFLYLFVALIASIIVSLIPRNKSNKNINKIAVENLKKIKTTSNIQKQII
jgi:hypothetical protein